MGNIKFKKFLLENNIKQIEVANFLGISSSSFSLKINEMSGRGFSANEIKKICKEYNISADKYFFNL